VSYVDSFLKCHGNNLLFELFLYPYFEKQTISIDNFGLLVKLFRYVHDCCVRLELALTVGVVVPYAVPKFSWNKIPGQDDAKLLTSLKEIFSLEDLDKDILLISSIVGALSSANFRALGSPLLIFFQGVRMSFISQNNLIA
jgi:hypothetical protein